MITFPGGEGTVDPETGAGTVQYDGSVTGAFVAGVAQYQVTFADAEWVTPAQMPDGSWSVTLDPATADLGFGTNYAIYTWQAHTHSTPARTPRRRSPSTGRSSRHRWR